MKWWELFLRSFRVCVKVHTIYYKNSVGYEILEVTRECGECHCACKYRYRLWFTRLSSTFVEWNQVIYRGNSELYYPKIEMDMIFHPQKYVAWVVKFRKVFTFRSYLEIMSVYKRFFVLVRLFLVKLHMCSTGNEELLAVELRLTYRRGFSLWYSLLYCNKNYVGCPYDPLCDRSSILEQEALLKTTSR